jgi:hypothetical protein
MGKARTNEDRQTRTRRPRPLGWGLVLSLLSPNKRNTTSCSPGSASTHAGGGGGPNPPIDVCSHLLPAATTTPLSLSLAFLSGSDVARPMAEAPVVATHDRRCWRATSPPRPARATTSAGPSFQGPLKPPFLSPAPAKSPHHHTEP